MAEVLRTPLQQSPPPQPPLNILENKPRLPPTSVAIPGPGTNARNGHLNLDVFSPVNQNGSFEFDRVLKSGDVYKRTRKTKVGIEDVNFGESPLTLLQQWKRFYLVLRPNLLSIYKNSSEEKLHKQISLSDLTAVAYLKDPKGRRQNIFGLFSPAKNFHLQGVDDKDARDWVELIRHEARIDVEEAEMTYGSPIAKEGHYQSLAHTLRSSDDHDPSDRDQIGSSSPEPAELSRPSTTRDGIRIPTISKSPAHEFDYSGNDHGSYSDFSDTAPVRLQNQISAPLSNGKLRAISNVAATSPSSSQTRPEVGHNLGETSVPQADQDPERVIWHGYLLCLKSKGGVRQWKKLWVVLRPKNLAFYKNEEEYSAHLIISLSSIISAVEIDPVSRSKAHCMQIIAEEKSFRFCAANEEALARWLGALKSQLARRKENSTVGRRV
ncbi:hypothetical protein MMC13_007503 [Lambiella insularis]|nr:hypothetical protein [Lambiella insularis]